MALKRATKSIPLSGGIIEEVDDFLLEPAGMQYVENGRFTKKDLVEKSRPWEWPGGATGYSNYTSNLNGFWSDGDQRAALIGNNEVCSTRDAGDTWTDTALSHDILGMERVLATAEQPGGMNYSCAPMGLHSGSAFAISTWLVCFERVSMDLVTNERDVVMQTYDNASGHMIDEQVINDACSPQALSGGGVSGGGYCYYTNTTNGNLVGYGTPRSGIGWSLVYNGSKDIQLYCGYNNRSDERFDANNYGDLRMGHSWQMHDNNACYVAYYDPENTLGNIVFKAEATGAMKIQLMSSGVPTGSEYTITTDIVSLTTVAPLDTFSDASYVYVLYGVFNNVGNTWDLRCTQWDKGTTSSIHTYTIENDLDEIFINGSIRKANDGDIYIVWTSANGYPTQTMQHTVGQHRVKWERVSGGDWSSVAPAIQETDSLYGHRLISNVAPDKDSDAGIVVQQWNNWNPSDDYASGADQNVFTPLLTGKKPVTSILVNIGDSTTHTQVVATFDAAQSKAVPFSTDEQSIHKGGNLWYFSSGLPGFADSNRWHYGNRITLVEEDNLFFMDRTAAPAWGSAATPNAGARAKYAEGASRFSVYHVNSIIDVHSASFPDGLIMGTSVPTWYDAKGETIMSAGPLDSPEIVSVRDAGGGDGASYNAYSDLVVLGEGAKVYQAVWVFSDSSGRVHRSAPSVPVYVGKMKGSDTTTTSVLVNVTAPIVLQRARGALFLEVYEAWPGGVPQLAQTYKVPQGALDAGITVTCSVPSNDTPDGATNTDIADYRSSKAIYTAGNVLAADPWPNFTSIVSSGRRLFAQALGDPSTIYYSKTFEQNVSPEFSASLVITLGNEEITALGAIDDKLIAFTKNGMWLIYGTGPDNTGANGDFFVEKMTHKIGCTEQRSIVTYEAGIAFYSNTTGEYHVLGRDLQLVDIGDSVKGLSERIITSYDSLVDAAEHEIQWYVDITVGTEYQPAGGTTSPAQPPRPWQENVVGFQEAVLVYNYKYAKWCMRTIENTFSTGVIKGGVNLINGVPAAVDRSLAPEVYRQHEATWEDAEHMKWETPWIKVNQLQDFGRFWGATFLGKYQSSWTDNGSGTEAGDLQVTVKYDYEGSAGSTDVVRFRANKDFNPANGDNLQFEVPPSRQKCQAIKFVIEEIATEAVEVWEPTYTTGRGYVLAGVDLHYGAKGGSSRLSAGRKK